MGLSTTALILLLGIPVITLAEALLVPQKSRSPIHDVRIRSQECANQGDSDVYGLGVRVGLYLQWLASFILRNIGSWDTMTSVRTANNALCIALALAETIRIVERKALAIDYLLSYYLTVILFYSESYRIRLEVGKTVPLFKDMGLFGVNNNAPTRASPEMKDKIQSYTLVPDLSLIFQNAFFAAYTLIGAWFWLHGIKRIQDSPCSDHAAIILLFHLRNQSWYTAATVLAIVLGLFWAIVFVVNLYMFTSAKGTSPGPIIISTFRFFRLISATTHDIPQPQEIGDRFKRPLSRNIFHYIWMNLFGPFVAIISVERIISSNGLSTSDISSSTGQMISLLTGITSVLCALWELDLWFYKDDSAPTEPLDDTNQSDSAQGRRDSTNTHRSSSSHPASVNSI
ncbi:hypothetical protein N7493_002155 [Penicillium malachiteum]|uniref:Uncharacterized protein n=1 Tax=Penicillium malachiteum TaxID=1324776 RepID=A0AAD6HRC9_9EURO|nr:hypothetical protein N7493_002155 [Penicillium malachiteum]